MRTNRPVPPSSPRPGTPDAPRPARRIQSRELFEDGKEVVIEHANQAYRLRITRQNKLILTK